MRDFKLENRFKQLVEEGYDMEDAMKIALGEKEKGERSHSKGGFIDHLSDSFWFSAGPGEGMF